MANLEILIMRDTRANQPAAGIAGRLYYVTDESVLERDNGSTWEDVSTGTAPDAGDVTYTPTTGADWDDPDPTEVEGALDQLAGRVADVEALATGGLTNSSITPTTTNVTAAVGTRYFADISGLTADRNFVLPACSVGDEIELKITVGDDAYELVVIGDTGVTIEGGSAATEWSRLFISGEVVRFVASGTNAWRVTYDGRIRCIGRLELSAAETTNTAGASTTPTWDTAVINVGNMADLVNYRFNIRRAGYYSVSGSARANSNLADQKYIISASYVNATLFSSTLSRQSGGAQTGPTAPLASKTALCAVGDYILFQWSTTDANMGLINNEATFFEVREQ